MKPAVPLLITAELPPDIFGWADALRRAHYPPDRLRLRAHVTLFHSLPPSAAGEVRRMLADVAGATPTLAARTAGLLDFGRGTAIAVESPGLMALHGELARRLHGVALRPDDRPLTPHITIQDKVRPELAAALQEELGPTLIPRSFHFRALGLYGWHDELWNLEREFALRAAAQSRG